MILLFFYPTQAWNMSTILCIFTFTRYLMAFKRFHGESVSCNCSHKFFFLFLLHDSAYKPWYSSCSNIPHFWGCLPVGKQARLTKLMAGELLIWDWHWVQTNCSPCRSVGVNVCLGLRLFTWIVTFLATGFSAMNALPSFPLECCCIRRGFLQLSF